MSNKKEVTIDGYVITNGVVSYVSKDVGGSSVVCIPYQIRIINENEVDNGSFMIGNILCFVECKDAKYNLAIANEKMKPLNTAGQIFIKDGDSWIDAVTTTKKIQDRFDKRMKREAGKKLHLIEKLKKFGVESFKVENFTLPELESFVEWMDFFNYINADHVTIEEILQRIEIKLYQHENMHDNFIGILNAARAYIK